MEKFNWDIIKGYDIRGIFDIQLTRNDIFLIGLAFGFYIDQNFSNNKKIVIGQDNRSSSQEIFHILTQALSNFPIEIYNIGNSSSPILSFATQKFNCCGIMITASHNHVSFNGMKISKPNSESLDGSEIKKIIESFLVLHSSSQNDCNSHNDAKKINCNVFNNYIDFLFSHLKITKEDFFLKISDRKIAFDFFGSNMENITQEFFEDHKNCLFVQNDILIDDPDPTLTKNLINLQNLIQKEKCDFGFAFDGDCDRITVLDENGKLIKIEHLSMLFSQTLKTSNNENRKIVHDVRFSSKFSKFLVNELNCNTFKSKIGHSIIKKTMKENDANLSCETSGHFIFENIGFDDGFYAALFFMANVTLSEKLSDIVDRLPEIHCSENIKIYLKNKDIEKKVQSIVEKAKFMNKEIEFFDGIKILDENGWIFFRQSRTEECLTIKFESYKKENFEKKRSEMEDFLKN